MKPIMQLAKIVWENKESHDDYWNGMKRNHADDGKLIEHSQSDFDVSIDDVDTLKLELGQRWKTNLGNLRSFIELYKYLFSRKRMNELGISTHTEQLLELFGNEKKNVSNVLKKAQACGLLQCVNDDYRWRNPKFKKSVAYPKRYICNKEVQDMIVQVCKDEGIEWKQYRHKNKVWKKKGNVADDVYRKIKVSPNLRVPAAGLSDDDVKAILDEKYPQVARCKELANIDNMKLEPVEQIKCDWNIHRSKKFITKIGFRATSSIVSFKAHENENTDYKGVWRAEYLESKYGKDWYSYDVKSSVYRLTYFLNSGKWPDDDVDFYELMYGQKFADDEERAIYKHWKMRPYFDAGNCVVNHVKHLVKEESAEDLKRAIENDMKVQEEVIGKSLRSEIFLHESCLYMEVVHELRERGHKVSQVYDAWYSNDDIREESREILKEKSSEYRRKYIGHISIGESSLEGSLLGESSSGTILPKKEEFDDSDIPDDSQGQTYFTPDLLQKMINEQKLSKTFANKVWKWISGQDVKFKESCRGWTPEDVERTCEDRKIVLNHLLKNQNYYEFSDDTILEIRKWLRGIQAKAKSLRSS